MIEDYRPTSFEEVVDQPVERIQALLDGGETPNFLFHGPPGTGKTTTARIISREIQGSAGELMEYNASDDRGIDPVRDEIIPVVDQTTLTGAPRVIFLDEMDSMTKDAQQALRQPMEQSDAIFILACNDLGAVHDAVQSRCHDFEFAEISEPALREYILGIADDEGVDLTRNEINTITACANGDMRVALQRYQQYARGAYPDEEQLESESGSLEADARRFLEGED